MVLLKNSGDLSKTSSWYEDFQSMFMEEYYWLARGNMYQSTTDAGIFAFSRATTDECAVYLSFRLVISSNL